ncbi:MULTISPECIES: hypothetical protein [unclassified Bradyrhizobium]|uniref:hypothetical protein n=1 Tax=unclassified Bradyrhizobium TaxID=2631580 RepID=UPI001CD4156A|nr:MULTISPECIES: hypothetical protein [unclassified Bradyrhizobium]MCA1384206.1 hypothetical protein [Bradyrhizobium sp. BRP05]MCA1393530.1 hypothetical protein [Bradyrhizobium sp. IC3123]MCA1420948.1 hypothetical protein [Bradyrhizobium sp. BRP23]MCA1430850.1 hypothetical protein [Bradyrhizobium sp. NBAIM16]MCA1436357.1 hypothetical protein [Bradyrhizobium sp. BRP20]
MTTLQAVKLIFLIRSIDRMDKYAAIDDRLIDAMGDEFQIWLKQRLAEAGLTDDAEVKSSTRSPARSKAR